MNPEMQPLLESQPLTIDSVPHKEQATSQSKNGSGRGKKNSSKLTLAKKAKYQANRKDSPLSRLGVTKDQLLVAPQITPFIKEVGKRFAFTAMRFSSEPMVVAFLEKYDSISKRDRERLSMEAIGLGANLDLRHLLGEIVVAITEYSVTSVKIIARAAHPKVIKSRVKFAQQQEGYRDRDALDTMLGALPVSKGISIFNKIVTGQSDEQMPSDKPEAFDDDLDVVFPDVSKMQERVQPMRQKVLEAGK